MCVTTDRASRGAGAGAPSTWASPRPRGEDRGHEEASFNPRSQPPPLPRGPGGWTRGQVLATPPQGAVLAVGTRAGARTGRLAHAPRASRRLAPASLADPRTRALGTNDASVTGLTSKWILLGPAGSVVFISCHLQENAPPGRARPQGPGAGSGTATRTVAPPPAPPPPPWRSSRAFLAWLRRHTAPVTREATQEQGTRGLAVGTQTCPETAGRPCHLCLPPWREEVPSANPPGPLGLPGRGPHRCGAIAVCAPPPRAHSVPVHTLPATFPSLDGENLPAAAARLLHPLLQ